jgi:hypothetical protein
MAITVLVAGTLLLQGCPREQVLQSCYLNNILVNGGLRMLPATDSLPLGDTLWISGTVPRNVFDNNNQPVNLDGKGLATKFEMLRVSPYGGLVQPDFKVFANTGTITETKINGNFFQVNFQYATATDSMKLLAGFVPVKKGVYEIRGTNALYNPPSLSFNSTFSTPFYKTGNCYQGALIDSFSNPNRHWYLYYPALQYNFAHIYYVKFY